MADYLLIDFGSTNIKYAVYNVETAQFLMEATVPFPEKILNNNDFYYEVDPNRIIDILNMIINSMSMSPKGIMISVQMHGYILNDRNLNPITPYISWRDRRSLINLNDRTFYEMFEDEKIIWNERGTSYKSNLPLVSLFAQKHLYPKMFKNVEEFFTLGSFIAYTLTGNNAAHITDCAATGLYNTKTGEPVEDLGIKLPKAYKNVEIIGGFKGIPIYSPIGDHQASFLGCDVSDEQYLLNIGTAAQLSTLSYIKSELYESRPYFDERILCTITGLIGGHMIWHTSDIGQQLINNYSLALRHLPKKNALMVCGGVANHQPNLIKEVCTGIGLPYHINQNNSAIAGLKKIAEEAENNGI